MTPVKDPFSYAGRWDSIGLTCSSCEHFAGPDKWPDLDFSARCSLHNISLKILYDSSKSGFLADEYFCHEFSATKRALQKAVDELETVRNELFPRVLYSGYNDSEGRKTLREFPFNEL